MTMPSRYDRRDFLGTASGAAVTLPGLFGAAGHAAAADRPVVSPEGGPGGGPGGGGGGVFSFPFGDRVIRVSDWPVSFLIYTDENVYTPDPATMNVRQTGDVTVVNGTGFAFAGLQQHENGAFRAEFRLVEGGFDCEIEATMQRRIKGSALLVRTGEVLEVPDRDCGFKPAATGANVCRYPGTAYRFPVFPFKHGDGTFTTAGSLDPELRSKVVALTNGGGTGYLELHHQEHAGRWGQRHATPTWCVRRGRDPGEVFARRRTLMETAWQLRSWEERTDVPTWSKQIGLVLNLHGMHWTGYMFNSYPRQLEAIRAVANRLEGRHVLALLCGWDGRYNFNWPRYRADERMGGAEGLETLVKGAHELGVHVIPQIGAVSANRTYLPPALHEAAWHDGYGNPYVKDVDWDGDRQGDTYRVNANISHPGFGRFLLEESLALVERFGFDGMFLDINMHYQNDPRFDPLTGHRAFAEGLRQRYPQALVFGENWFDALMPTYPLVHSVNARGAGLLRGWPDMFSRYCRTTYHLIHPAPGRGSTGVHEAGWVEPYEPDPDVDAIPALSIVDDTLDRHLSAIDRHAAIAKRYLSRMGLA